MALVTSSGARGGACEVECGGEGNLEHLGGQAATLSVLTANIGTIWY